MSESSDQHPEQPPRPQSQPPASPPPVPPRPQNPLAPRFLPPMTEERYREINRLADEQERLLKEREGAKSAVRRGNGQREK